jgi:hypothetical protein
MKCLINQSLKGDIHLAACSLKIISEIMINDHHIVIDDNDVYNDIYNMN